MKLCLIDLHNPMIWLCSAMVSPSSWHQGVAGIVIKNHSFHFHHISDLTTTEALAPQVAASLALDRNDNQMIFEGEGLSVINVIPCILSMILYDVVSLDNSFACIFSWLLQNL